jgi:hypothetical protein
MEERKSKELGANMKFKERVRRKMRFRRYLEIERRKFVGEEKN